MFTRGELNEIIPFPLVEGLAEEDLFAWWKEQTGHPGTRAILALIVAAYHQYRMREMFRAPRTPEEKSLANAILSGAAVSIAPVGMQDVHTLSAYGNALPIFQRVDNDRWRLGWSADGFRCEEWNEADPAKAMEQAQQRYAGWLSGL